MALRRSIVAQTFAGSLFSLIMRPTNASMRRSFGSVGLIKANSLSRSAGVARMSLISVLQNTTLPAPIMAIFLAIRMLLLLAAHYNPSRNGKHEYSLRGRLGLL